MQKGEFFVTGEVFLLDIGLLMGAIAWGISLPQFSFGSVHFLIVLLFD